MERSRGKDEVMMKEGASERWMKAAQRAHKCGTRTRAFDLFPNLIMKKSGIKIGDKKAAKIFENVEDFPRCWTNTLTHFQDHNSASFSTITDHHHMTGRTCS